MSDKKRLKEILSNLKMFIAGDEFLEATYSDIVLIEEMLKKQNEENNELKEFYKAMYSFYGEGLEVANWHLNGDYEPFDNFIDDNDINEDLREKILAER